MSARRRAAALGMAVALFGCTGAQEPAPDVVLDLAAALATAQPLAAVGEIPVTGPTASRFLGSGWARREGTADGERFVWSQGASSLLLLPILEPRAVELVLRCRSFSFPGAPRQRVEVELRGETVAELELSPSLAEYRVPLPAAALRSGTNPLRLRYRYHRSPRELGLSRDRRSLAVALHDLRLADTQAAEAAPAAEEGRLYLPWHTQVDYFLPLPAGSALWARTVRARGGDGRLQVTLQREGAMEVDLGDNHGDGDDDGAGLALELGDGEAGGLARIRLRALPRGDGTAAPATGGILLEAPRIVAADAATAPEPPTAEVATPHGAQAGRPDVVLYLIDTLRADHLGSYGDPRGLTPEIDDFANEAALFENVLAQSSWTRPATASMLTGHWPPVHGAVGRRHGLSEAATTLPEILREAGYHTAAVLSNVNVTAAFGFTQGFDDVVYRDDLPDSEALAEEAARFIAGDERPLFLFVHTIDPHAPYAPPKDLRERHADDVRPEVAAATLPILGALQTGTREPEPRLTAELARLYAAEVAANDRGFGQLLDLLRRHGRYAESAVLLTSDHGEELGEHGGFQHARTLHAESLRVPLLLKPPQSAGLATPRRLAGWVQHADLLPTILELAGLPLPVASDGESLVARLRDGPGTAPPPGFVERPLFAHLGLGAEEVALVDGPWKAIFDLAAIGPVRGRLFHLPSDPGEHLDLAAERPVRIGFYASAVRQKLAAPGERLAAPAARIDDEVAAELRALGYIE